MADGRLQIEKPEIPSPHPSPQRGEGKGEEVIGQ